MQINKYSVNIFYHSPYPNPIIFKKGECVTIGKEFTDDPEWKDWLWCTGENNNSAWTPKQFIDRSDDGAFMNRDYNALELTIETGETLTISEIVNGFGFATKENGEQGWAPMKCLQPL